MKYDNWIKSIKYILSYRLKITQKPNTIITVDKIVSVGYDYLISKFPNNHNIESTIFNILQKLTRQQYLKKVKWGYKVNTQYNKPIRYLPTKIGKGIRLGDCIIENINGELFANYHGRKFKFGVGV